MIQISAIFFRIIEGIKKDLCIAQRSKSKLILLLCLPVQKIPAFLLQHPSDLQQ